MGHLQEKEAFLQKWALARAGAKPVMDSDHDVDIVIRQAKKAWIEIRKAMSEEE